MDNLSPMVSMAKTPEEVKDDCSLPCPGDSPKYPYGLCISLCQDELEKLGYTSEDFQTGDIVHLHALALVTSTSCSTSMSNEPTCRIELQITHIECESEDEENEEEDTKMSKLSKHLSKLYT